MYPLSSPFRPILGPKSEICIPGYGSIVFGSLIGTMKLLRPWQFMSGVYNFAVTHACVAVLPEWMK